MFSYVCMVYKLFGIAFRNTHLYADVNFGWPILKIVNEYGASNDVLFIYLLNGMETWKTPFANFIINACIMINT